MKEPSTFSLIFTYFFHSKSECVKNGFSKNLSKFIYVSVDEHIAKFSSTDSIRNFINHLIIHFEKPSTFILFDLKLMIKFYMSQNRIFVEFGQIRLCICEYGTLRIFLFISNMNIVLVFKLYIHHIITRATISFHTTNSYSNESNISYPLLKIQINFSTGMLSIMNSDTINIWMIIMLFNKLSRL